MHVIGLINLHDYSLYSCISYPVVAVVDYTPTTTTLTFPIFSGGGTKINFDIPITDDLLSESTETFGLSATIVYNRGNFTVGGDTANCFIIDNDGGYVHIVNKLHHHLIVIQPCSTVEPRSRGRPYN